jgi:hypothetical protein
LIIYYCLLKYYFQKKWINCYDSSKKYRIGKAIVKIINLKDGLIYDCGVTDLIDRFVFVQPRGKYQVIINAENFTFPSIIDSKYQKEVGKVIIEPADRIKYYEIPLDQKQ